jgi:hypothetical protein
MTSSSIPPEDSLAGNDEELRMREIRNVLNMWRNLDLHKLWTPSNPFFFDFSQLRVSLKYDLLNRTLSKTPRPKNLNRTWDANQLQWTLTKTPIFNSQEL